MLLHKLVDSYFSTVFIVGKNSSVDILFNAGKIVTSSALV